MDFIQVVPPTTIADWTDIVDSLPTILAAVGVVLALINFRAVAAGAGMLLRFLVNRLRG